MSVEANKLRVQSFWETLYARDWDGIAAFFTGDSEYTDVPSPADDVARGPDQIVARLRLGLEPHLGLRARPPPHGGRGRHRGHRARRDLALAYRRGGRPALRVGPRAARRRRSSGGGTTGTCRR